MTEQVKPYFIKENKLYRAAVRYADGSVSRLETDLLYQTPEAAKEAARRDIEGHAWASRMTGWICLALFIGLLAFFGYSMWPWSSLRIVFLLTFTVVPGTMAYGALIRDGACHNT